LFEIIENEIQKNTSQLMIVCVTTGNPWYRTSRTGTANGGNLVQGRAGRVSDGLSIQSNPSGSAGKPVVAATGDAAGK
jgi:hypothetical protein